MAANGAARKAGDRRRVRANRVVDVSNTGKASRVTGFRISRTAEFHAGRGAKNGRA